MKLEIIGKPLAAVKIDMRKFKKDYKKQLDLKSSIKSNFKVISKGKFKKDILFRFVHLGLDWGRILNLINEISTNEMEIRFFRVNFKDKVELFPDLVSDDGRLFIFRQELKEGNDVMMINSFIGSPDFDIKNYLNITTFNFGKIKWKPLIDLR